MIRIAVCDAELYYRDTVTRCISTYLEQSGLPCQIDAFHSGTELLELGVEVTSYTGVFLEVNLNGLDGITTARKIHDFSEQVFVVFVTAHEEYALEGYRVDAVRYILKSEINFKAAIQECMDVFMKRKQYMGTKKEIKFNEGIKRVNLDRVLYVESKLHKLEAYILEDTRNKYTLYKTLDRFEEELLGNSFLRIHQSFLVNMKHILNIKRYEVQLSDGEILGIPKARYKDVKERYLVYRGDL